MHPLEVPEVVAAAAMPHNGALHVASAGRVLVPCGRVIGHHRSGVAVDVRGGAVPPSSACAHSTYWIDWGHPWRV